MADSSTESVELAEDRGAILGHLGRIKSANDDTLIKTRVTRLMTIITEKKLVVEGDPRYETGELTANAKVWMREIANFFKDRGRHDLLEHWIDPKYRREKFLEDRAQLAKSYLLEIDNCVTGGFVRKVARESSGSFEIIWKPTAIDFDPNTAAVAEFLSEPCGVPGSLSLYNVPWATKWTDPIFREDHIEVDFKECERDKKYYRHYPQIFLNASCITSEFRMKEILAHEYAHILNRMFFHKDGYTRMDSHGDNWEFL
ncbi:hypothetical protein ABW19_dt0203756 [Dactylella cylindrospora]|nr:hypothetical protein ABW19_dt0203756 [Dactylella cylindrospora]